jgi:hypothetical protein
MSYRVIQSVGIAWICLLSILIVILYATKPQTIRDITTGASVVAGTYQIDEARFNAARELFLRDQFSAARDEWGRADPAKRDARTQFYIAYAFYRQGWGRTYHDDALFRQGLEAINHSLSLAPDRTLVIDDQALKIKAAAELKSELEAGLQRSVEDLNPARLIEERK